MKKLNKCCVVLSVLLLSGIITLVGSSPAMSVTYDLAGAVGTTSSVWSYSTNVTLATSASPGSWAAGNVLVSLSTAYNYSLNSGDASLITWTAPTAGTISISGDAWYAATSSGYSSADNVYLQLIPKSLAGSLSLDNVTQTGTTSLANGTVQAGYSSVTNKSSFGSISIPLIDVSSLTNLTVQAGDVIALLVVNMSTSGGNIDGVDLTIDETPTGGSTPVPEPCTMLLMGSGLAGLAGFRKKFRNNKPTQEISRCC